MSSRLATVRWAGAPPTDRVRIYTVGSLYVLAVSFTLLAWVGALEAAGPTSRVVAVTGLALLLSLVSVLALRRVMQRGAGRRLRATELGPLLAVAATAQVTAWAMPAELGTALAMMVAFALSWGLGGAEPPWMQHAVIAVAPVLGWTAGGDVAFILYLLAVSAFLVFTVRSSLWLLRVVEELDAARDTAAALAVAEERLRFSRDVHDVLGRRLSEIAVQAELASAYLARADARAAETISGVRGTAHTALREARELARGYRPVDLGQELMGARSLLRSAGIEATTDLDGLPQRWAEPVARVVREAVTNVLRHSRATWVTVSYDGASVTVLNDGAPEVAHTWGTGLAGLSEQLAPLGAEVVTSNEDGVFGVRVVLEQPAEHRVAAG